MEPKNHPIEKEEKENHPPDPEIFVGFKMLIFQGY